MADTNTAAARVTSQLAAMMDAQARYERGRPSPSTYCVIAKRRFAVTLSTHETVEAAREALAAAVSEWSDAPTLLFIHSGAYGAESHTEVGR